MEEESREEEEGTSSGELTASGGAARGPVLDQAHRDIISQEEGRLRDRFWIL